MSQEQPNLGRKVVVVGAGNGGATFCYALAQSGLADEIVLVDRNADLAKGQAMDLAHGQAYFPAVSIRTGGVEDYADAGVIVITAGRASKADETRLQLLTQNAAIMSSIVDDIVAQRATGVILVVSNPVDVLTHVALKHSGWGRERVIGSGTVLDSARFRYLLGEHCGVDVRDSAYHIIGYKGSTCFGVGMALVRIVGAILRGENSVLTVSTRLDGEFGLHDVCLSVPCVVGRHGVVRIVESDLSEQERSALNTSAAVLKQALGDIAH